MNTRGIMVAGSFNPKFLTAQLRSKCAGLPARLLDLIVALPLCLCFSPLWLFHFLVARLQGDSWLVYRPILGANARQIYLPEARELNGLAGKLFNGLLIRRAILLWSVVRGQLSLVGPRPISPGDERTMPSRFLRRLDARPGLVHTWFLKSAANIAFEDERVLAVEDVEVNSIKQRIAMLLRAVPALLFRSKEVDLADPPPPILRMFGLDMQNKTMAEAVTDLMTWAREPGGKRRIAYVNPACFNIAVEDPDYRAILDASDIVYPDGIGIQVACKMLKLRMVDNLNGTDMFPALCERIQDTSIGIYLLGAQPGVVDSMVEKLSQSYPNLTVAGSRHGYMDPSDIPHVVRDINASGAHILFVAMGVPAQEKWINTAWPLLQVPVTLGVGGLFDFMSGRIPRAPAWMREMGLEWFYRLCQEPGRLWKRYVIGNVVFLWNVMRYGK